MMPKPNGPKKKPNSKNSAPGSRERLRELEKKEHHVRKPGDAAEEAARDVQHIA